MSLASDFLSESLCFLKAVLDAMPDGVFSLVCVLVVDGAGILNVLIPDFDVAVGVVLSSFGVTLGILGVAECFCSDFDFSDLDVLDGVIIDTFGVVCTALGVVDIFLVKIDFLGDKVLTAGDRKLNLLEGNVIGDAGFTFVERTFCLKPIGRLVRLVFTKGKVLPPDLSVLSFIGSALYSSLLAPSL